MSENIQNRAYVEFICVNKPWLEHNIVLASAEVRPHKMLPLFEKTYKAMLEAKPPEQVGRPGRAVSYLIAQAPAIFTFHSRLMAPYHQDISPNSAFDPNELGPDAPYFHRVYPFSVRIDFYYRVYCMNEVNQNTQMPWEVEILEKTPKFVESSKIEAMQVVHARSTLADLAAYVERLANLSSLGGTHEQPH